ncbi:hypothetical protein N431DRAFT_543622 [Stipitochalara longipes BDJ]|nr:hypothetical protein N431DRAFT_543622 [Stipitochalara longipes BDJ]
MATKASASDLLVGEVSNQWNWVNVSHPRDLNHAANITTIRRRAMLAVHRDKRRNRAKQILPQPKHRTNITSGGAQSVDWENADDISEDILPHGSRKVSRSSHSMLDIPTSIDRRICYTAHLNYPNQSYLLNHWTSVMASLLLPVCRNHNSMSSIFAYHAFGDPLLMCALLLHAAVHLDAVNQRQPSRLTLHYGMEAARQMSLRLDSKSLYLQDTSIAAVVMILANQIMTSDLVEMQIHLNALEIMVQMRGGLETLGMDGFLQMSIKWVDTRTAILQNSKPRFTHAASPSRLADLMISNFTGASLSSFDLQIFSQMNITTALFRVRQEIMNLADMQSLLMACPSRTSTVETLEFAARRTSIEHVLLLASQGFASMQNPDQDARLREACCISGSIYVNSVFWGLQPSPTISLKTLKRRLMACVERLELEDHDKSDLVPASIAVLFWALNVGGTIAVDLEERTWFVLRLSRAAKQIGLRSWEQILSVLNCFLWEAKLENDAWKGIWADLKELIVMG